MFVCIYVYIYMCVYSSQFIQVGGEQSMPDMAVSNNAIASYRNAR